MRFYPTRRITRLARPFVRQFSSVVSKQQEAELSLG